MPFGGRLADWTRSVRATFHAGFHLVIEHALGLETCVASCSRSQVDILFFAFDGF